jgi:hypothetical protein
VAGGDVAYYGAIFPYTNAVFFFVLEVIKAIYPDADFMEMVSSLTTESIIEVT